MTEQDQKVLVHIAKPSDPFERSLDILCNEFKRHMRNAKQARRGKVVLVASVGPDGSLGNDCHVEPAWEFPLNLNK